MPADLKTPTHGDIERTPESLLEKLSDGCNLELPCLLFQVEFNRDIYIGVSEIISACDGAEDGEMPNAVAFEPWPQSLERYGQCIARSTIGRQGALSHSSGFAPTWSGSLVEAPERRRDRGLCTGPITGSTIAGPAAPNTDSAHES